MQGDSPKAEVEKVAEPAKAASKVAKKEVRGVASVTVGLPFQPDLLLQDSLSLLLSVALPFLMP